MRRTLLVVVLAAFSAPVLAQDDPRFAEGIAALSRGQLDEVEASMRQVVQTYATSETTLNTADRHRYVVALSLLATASRADGRLQEAEALLRRAVAASDRRSAQFAESLDGLAGVLVDRGEHGEAESLASRALKICEELFGKHSPELVPALNTLAEIRVARGDIDEAERLLRRADRIAAKPGTAWAVQAVVAARRGALWLSMGRYREAEPALERSLEMAEEAVGPDHPAMLLVMRLLADCYRLRNRPKDAAPIYERFLAMGEKAYGPEHPLLLPGLAGRAEVAERLGDDARAGSLFQRAAGIAYDQLDARSADQAVYISLLAGFHARHHQSARAEALYREALAAFEGPRGAKHNPHQAMVVEGLRSLYLADRRYAEVDQLKRAFPNH